MPKKLRFLICTIFMLLNHHSVVYANIPAAYLACEGAEERAPCALPGPQYGVCITDTLCTDPPETSVNECVICVDECWASQDGLACIRPWTGEMGVCESQDRCTDKPETSFEECRRCVEGMAWSENDEDIDNGMITDTGCSQSFSIFSSSWFLNWLSSLFCLIFIILYLRSEIKKQNNRNLDE